MALPSTGYTASSAKNFVIDAGTIFTDVTYDSTTQSFTGTPLGATNGGVGVNIAATYRKVEVDGTYIMDVVGLNLMSGMQCTITAKLKELTAANLRLAINGVLETADTTEAPAGYKKITGKRYLQEGDYIPSIAIVGKLTGATDPIVFMLDNGLVTSALDLQTEDQKEGEIEVTIQANANFDQLAANEFPWRIYHPDPVLTP